MEPLLVLRHVDCEGLGYFGTFLDEAGIHFKYLDTPRAPLPRTLSGYRGLVVLGGPMGVYEQDRYPFIKSEIGLAREALDRQLPLLGVCLGSQIIAAAAGAEVYPGGKKEIGWFPISLTPAGRADPLFEGVPSEFTVFHWHGDTFDLPPGAVHLASSAAFPHQALGIGRRAYALQCHVEVTPGMVKEWVEQYRAELETLAGSVDPVRVLSESAVHDAALMGHARRLFENFLTITGLAGATR